MRFAPLAGLFGICLTVAACGSSTEASRTLDHQDPNPGQQSSFPTHPDLAVTPGVLCASADAYRYPEHIAYCVRSVSSGVKADIIHQYDHDFGFTIESMSRVDFKIDHFIPLCMGGANARGNLWPQHKSVYSATDPLEMTLCQLMAAGKMNQEAAVEKIKYAKFHLNEAAGIEQQLLQQLSN